jgi:hypothetical protein
MKDLSELKLYGSTISYDVKEISKESSEIWALSPYVPDYALFSHVDEIPGILGTCIPFDPLEVIAPVKLCIKKPLYVSLIEVEVGDWNEQIFVNII